MTIKISTLSNGLRIATDTMTDAESVVVGLWIGAGSRHEDSAAGGVAHLTEHMMFKGTETRSAYKLSKLIEDKGGALNAHTSREETAYYAHVLPEHAESAVDILSDILMHSVYSPKEYERERLVVIQEIGRDLDTPEDHVYDMLLETAFKDQTLGRPILGSAQDIARMKREKVLRFVKTHYHTANSVLIACGKIDHEGLVSLAEKYFGAFPKGKPSPIVRAQFRHGHLMEEKASEQLHLMMAYPAPPYQGKGCPASVLLALLLGGGASSRLYQKVREKHGLAYHISTHTMPFRDSGLFCLYAGTSPDRAGKLMAIVHNEIKAVMQSVSSSELARAKAQLRADYLMGQESVMRRGERLGHQMLVYGKPRSKDVILAKINDVTREDITSMAQKLLSRRPAIAAVGDGSGMNHLLSKR